MAGNLCPFCNFQPCRNECNFFNDAVDGCNLSKGLMTLINAQYQGLKKHIEQIEQYLLDASNSLIDINVNTQ